MADTDERRSVARTLAALRREREGYVARGLDSRIQQVDAAIRALSPAGESDAHEQSPRQARPAPRRTG